MKILLGVTGSVAAKLTPIMVKELLAEGHEVQIVATESSLYFWKESDVSVRVWRDKDEWVGDLYVKDQDIPHISLRNWADVILIAPLSANTLAKMANGMCDNLLTSLMRAWNLEKPIVLAPAMNTYMWNHPATTDHLMKLRLWFKNFHLVNPISKTLACGEDGMGALAKISDIVKAVSDLKKE